MREKLGIKLRTVMLTSFLISCAMTLNHCGGGGGGTPPNGAAGELQTNADGSTSDGVKLVQDSPQTPVLHDGAPVTSMAVPSCPPPVGAAGNNTMNAYYEPGKAFDGDMNTWWVGVVGAGDWDLYYGFAAARQMDSFNITFYGASYVPAQIRLKVSMDGCNWTDLGLMSGGVKPEIAVSQSVKYLWVEMTGNPATNYPLIRDTDWVAPADDLYASGGPGANEAWYFPSNAFDGNMNTWWAGQPGAGTWNLYYVFDSPRIVQMPRIEFFNVNYRPASVELYTSNDGTSWTMEGELGPGDTAAQYVGDTKKYIWFKMTGNPPSNFPVIKDVAWDIPEGASSGDSINTFYKPENAFDGNMNTWWAGTQAQSEWSLFYRYATDTFIDDINITYYADSHAPASTELYTSNDGNTWALKGVFPLGASPTLSVGLTTRYLRFQMSGTPSIGYPLIKDITVDTTINRQSMIAAGYRHTCAVKPSGNVYCWGDNEFGQLGNGTNTSSTVPVQVRGIISADSISSSNDHTCVILSNATVMCWGRNIKGQLGDGSTTHSSVPHQVNGINSAVAIAVGGLHSCALLSNGTIQCWGDNYNGQLGDYSGFVGIMSPTPITVRGISTAVSVSAKNNSSCAVLSDGSAACWGFNGYGQLGNGTTTLSPVPVSVSGISTAASVALGGASACAMLSGGITKCWGNGHYGTLGNGLDMSSYTPVTASEIPGAVRIAEGNFHMCALFSSGIVKCWGYNASGITGNGSNVDSLIPVTVDGISSAVSIAAGSGHNCAVLSDGSAKCWGEHSYGQLGNGGANPYLRPVEVVGF